MNTKSKQKNLNEEIARRQILETTAGMNLDQLCAEIVNLTMNNRRLAQIAHQYVSRTKELEEKIEIVERTAEFEHFIRLISYFLTIRRGGNAMQILAWAYEIDRPSFFQELDRRRALTNEAMGLMANEYLQYTLKGRTNKPKWLEIKEPERQII